MNQKIAYVNLTRLMGESPLGILEYARNEEVKSVLIKAEAAAQKAYLSMSEEEKQNNRAVDVANINQSWLIEQKNSRSMSLSVALKKIEEYRKAKGFNIVLNSDYIVCADEEYDITNDILLSLKDINVDYGDLPTFTMKNDGTITGSDDGKSQD